MNAAVAAVSFRFMKLLPSHRVTINLKVELHICLVHTDIFVS